MPYLRGVSFSGGIQSTVTGFENDGILSVTLSGGSVAVVDAGYRVADVNLTGASMLTLRGLGDELTAELSGASTINAYEFPIGVATVRASGASSGRFMISDVLHADASGASVIYYRGNPSIDSTVSGASKVVKD
jgi:hypothetical protein